MTRKTVRARCAAFVGRLWGEPCLRYPQKRPIGAKNPGGTVPPPADLAVFGADAGRGQGSGGNSETAGAGAAEAGTSWEEERAAFFASLAQPSTGPVRAGVAVPAAGLGAAVGAAIDLGAALERDQRPVYVTRPHSESKALRREREKKVAAGHKADDHEDEPTYQQTM